MLSEGVGGGGLKLFLINRADPLNPLHLAFGEIIVSALRAGLQSSGGHMWTPGPLSLPTFGLDSPQFTDKASEVNMQKV